MTTKDLGYKLVDMCKQGQFMDAVKTLYADDIVSVEAAGDDQMPAEMRGLPAIIGKTEWWSANHDVHGVKVMGPYFNQSHPDQFAVHFDMDVTPKIGPAANQRINMTEVALYTARDGKVAREAFFYDMPGM